MDPLNVSFAWGGDLREEPRFFGRADFDRCCPVSRAIMRKSNASRNQSAAVEAPLGSKPLDAIGRALRAHYDELLREPLPSQFEELLSQLEAEETVKDAGSPGRTETE